MKVISPEKTSDLKNMSGEAERRRNNVKNLIQCSPYIVGQNKVSFYLEEITEQNGTSSSSPEVPDQTEGRLVGLDAFCISFSST